MSSIALSFCTPVMNRLGDLQATLRRNLDDNWEQRAQVEFVVACFDKDRRTADWVRANFGPELASGYLRFVHSDRLTAWHFGRAKNAFRELARGRIYASLDGDNFTGPGGGQHIIDVFEANGHDCVFHQFQGEWGDGTCGRVSMTMEDYRQIGYDDDFLPRQWDELDAILSILVHRPTRRYVCYRGKSIAVKSQPFGRFLRENRVEFRTVEIDPASDPLSKVTSGVAVGQHESTYVQDDDRLKYSSIFNHLSSFFKNTRDEALRTRYAGELVETQRAMAERIDPKVLLGWFLSPRTGSEPSIGARDVALAACIRNEDDLESWQAHYRRLGVTHFLIVDDGSTVPIAERVSASDTFVWTPRCGRFRYSKAFWLELLLRSYATDRWAVTVDSDEYIELPRTRQTAVAGAPAAARPLALLIEHAQAAGRRYFPGFLLDLVPDPSSLPALRAGKRLPRASFERYQFRPESSLPAYRHHNTVRWSYGEHADWAYRIDVRFRLNRAFDSLRKFPVFRMGGDIHLNQGFHDLIIGGKQRSGHDLSRPDLLAIRHYKLWNSQGDAVDASNRPADAYHVETRVNLERLRSNLHRALRVACASPFTHRFIDHRLVPVPGRMSIVLRTDKAAHDERDAFASSLNRSADIVVVLGDGEPGYAEGLIHAASLEQAIDWFRVHTPYVDVEARGDSHATLAARHGDVAEAAEPRLQPASRVAATPTR